jgi:hypothetical protein
MEKDFKEVVSRQSIPVPGIATFAGVMQLLSVNGVMAPLVVHPATLIDCPWNGIWKQDFASGMSGLDPTTVMLER